jgi:hypothetical protein
MRTADLRRASRTAERAAVLVSCWHGRTRRARVALRRAVGARARARARVLWRLRRAVDACARARARAYVWRLRCAVDARVSARGVGACVARVAPPPHRQCTPRRIPRLR